jgi:hypothetical protein
MASSGSSDVRWIVNQMPTKNKLEEPYSIAKEISNRRWEADAGHEPGFVVVFGLDVGSETDFEGQKTRGQETS